MDDKKLKELIEGIQQQLEAENLDYVMVVANHQEDGTTDGFVGVRADRGIEIPADILFCAAQNGKKGAQTFVSRIVENVYRLVGKYSAKLQTDPTKKKPTIYN